MSFHRMCSENPGLGIDDGTFEEDSAPVSREGQVQRRADLTVLMSLFERALLMYGEHSDEVRQQQWKGWDECFRDYLHCPNFRQAAIDLCAYWDQRFQAYLRKALEAHALAGTLADGGRRQGVGAARLARVNR